MCPLAMVVVCDVVTCVRYTLISYGRAFPEQEFVRVGGIPALLPLLVVPPEPAPLGTAGEIGGGPERGAGEAASAAGGAEEGAGPPLVVSESDFMGDVNLRYSVSQVLVRLAVAVLFHALARRR